MKVYKDISLWDFDAWSGGQDRLIILRKSERAMAEVETYLTEAFPEGLTETELNDMLWFDEKIDDIVSDIELGSYADVEDYDAE